MARSITIAVLAVALFVTGAWGYQEYQEKNTILVQAENNYQRAFHDLTYHIDLLHDTIGTTLALNTQEQLSPQLIDIWRLTSEAQMDVGQLPLGLLPFNKTEQFLADIGEFSYEVAARNLEDDPLSDEELDRLQQLYDSSDEIKRELRTVQHEVLNEGLRWMDVELALLSGDQPVDNRIIDGFEFVEHTAQGYSEATFPNQNIGLPMQHDGFHFVDGEDISKSEAEALIRNQFDLADHEEVNVNESGEGAQLSTYSGSFNKEDDAHGYINITEQGGHILSFILNRHVESNEIGLNSAQQKAEQLLEEQEIDDMVLLESKQYDNTGVFQFIYEENDVQVYPDRVQVKVALDDGEVLGFIAKDYYRNHRNRTFEEPKLSLEEAKDKVSPSVEIQDQHLAIVENNLGDEVLAYTFLGTIDLDTYRIVIDANTGVEVYVERLNDVETKWG